MVIEQDIEGQPRHRGRVQAQGGKTEESVTWARDTPPTKAEILHFIDLLEKKLKPPEKQERTVDFADLRAFIDTVPPCGIGAHPKPFKKSFSQRGSDGIRVDIEVQKGLACVPDIGPKTNIK